LTLEVAIYATFLGVAAFTRFWDLGSRALHHDESLHAYFSWLYYVGRGYTHDPMMHGPMVFHANALAYHLFGDSNYTARIAPAFIGTLIVVLPYFLRNQLGRVSMLIASFLLLISPFVWYYGRFVREDIYSAAWTMLLFIGTVRWLYSRRPGWLHLAVVGWTLLFCTKEISFILLFIWVTFAVGVLLLAHSRSSLAWLAVFPIGPLATMKVLPGVLGWAALPAIPFDNPSLQKSATYAQTMLASPQVVGALVWTGVWLLGLGLLLRRDDVLGQLRRLRSGEESSNALSVALAMMPRPLLQLGIAFGLFAAIAVPLYTSLFANFPGGLLSGTFGALFYWLAQQEVERGLQPWYYYVVLAPVYEPIAVLVGLSGIAYGLYWTVRRWGRTVGELTPFVLTYALLIYWAVVGFVLYSWAGEKMPWLTVHVVLPLILLAPVFGTRALGLEEGRRNASAPRRSGRWAFLGASAVVIEWTTYRMAGWSLQAVPQGPSPLVLGLLALAAISAGAVYWLGPRPAIRSLSLFGLGVLTLYTFQSAVRLSYQNGDVPVEQAVYVQTTPRAANVMKAITEVSERTAGGQSAEIVYDAEVSWPYVWYLRDFKNARYQSVGPTTVPQHDVEFVLVGADNESKVKPYLGAYTAYRYPMRWWFPEDMYRRIVPSEDVKDAGPVRGAWVQTSHIAGGLWGWRSPDTQAMLWRYVMYRRPDGILYSTDMVLYVRNDLVGMFNQARL